MTDPLHVSASAPESVLRKRFRDLVGEYEVLARGDTGQLSTDRAEQVRQELDRLADAIGGLEGCQ